MVHCITFEKQQELSNTPITHINLSWFVPFVPSSSLPIFIAELLLVYFIFKKTRVHDRSV